MNAPRLGGAIGALVAVLLLSACAVVPDTGPVRTSVPQAPGNDPAAVFLPNPPQDGMSPQDVVRGFVTAASAGQDYRVAKEFLTPAFARSWRPNASVLIHATPWGVDAADGDRVRLTVPTVAQVDGDGRYTAIPRTVSSTYQLTQVRGQWRISDGPDQVVLTQAVFPQVFVATQLQFFAPGYSRLVPDVRWFPRQTAAPSSSVAPSVAPAAVVQALLNGQAPMLQQVTLPVFPAGTALAAPVRTSDGVTTVSITLPGGMPSERDTDRIQQALAPSLGRSIASLRLVVNGRTAPVAPQPELQQPTSSEPLVVSGGRFGALSAQGTLSEDRELGPRIVQQDPSAITVSAQQRIAAVLNGRGQVVAVTRGGTRVVDDRRDLAAPTLDQRGWIYSVPENEPGGLRVSRADGTSSDVSSELDTTGVISIEASTDGTRLLVLRRTGAGTEAYVAGILRDGSGRPTGLTTDRITIDVDPTATALDATWVDQSTVAVLTSNASAQNVVQVQLGGLSTQLALLSNARTIVGATGQQDLRVLSRTGGLLVWSPSASVWAVVTPASVDIDVLAVQR
ncbi:LpqB family beta-propeller domain-containing protein [Amnibacterium endophyticum]|uniref:LpqB family beta-propeller domain-containing protein n=1 Tax=Amnibacterium endophyticum TaxID=2109337 RepID=A0ABW4L984_9MICO